MDVSNSHGLTALHLVTEREFVEVVEMLLVVESDVNQKDLDG